MVQAVGSIGAVAVAVLIAKQSADQALRMFCDETVRRVELVCSLGWQILHCAEAILLAPGPDEPRIVPENMERVAALAQSYPVEQFPSAEMGLRLTGMARSAAAFVKAHRAWLAYLENAESSGLPHLEAMRRVRAALHVEYGDLVDAGQLIADRLPGRRIALDVPDPGPANYALKPRQPPAGGASRPKDDGPRSVGQGVADGH